MSDSRSSLELLEDPKPRHPLALKIKKNIKDLRQDNRQLHLFWIRAHAGTPGNERADELAKIAAQRTDTDPHYAKIPLSYIKRKIREESVRKWQDRYSTSQTGRVTKIFFPNVGKAYSTVRKIKMTSLLCQAFTGHGGIAEYLHRFKLKDDPGCECNSSISETIEHLLLDCPRFAVIRMDTEYQMDTSLTKLNLQHILEDSFKRTLLTCYIETILRITNKRNSSLPPITATDPQIPTALSREAFPTKVQLVHQLLRLGERGEPGIRTRGVALFMDSNSERLGFCFCNAGTKGRVVISPGLAVLLNGSTSKNTMRRRTYDAMPEIIVAQNNCRMVRLKNKTIALFQWNLLETPFAQASSVMENIGKMDKAQSRCISVDTMAVGYEKGVVNNYLGCIEASKRHEVVVYENRGEDLSFLKTKKPGSTNSPRQDGQEDYTETTEAKSGSEKLQEKRALENTPSTLGSANMATSMLRSTVLALSTAIQSISGNKDYIKSTKQTMRAAEALNKFTNTTKLPTNKSPYKIRTRADMGQVNSPKLRNVIGPLDHVINAFLEFQAITKAEQEVSLRICKEIMQTYHLGNDSLLKVKLEEAEASIFDNNTTQTIIGQATGPHMTAYNATSGFVDLDEGDKETSNPPKYKTPPNDPIVVVARCTKIMLNKQILERAKTIAGSENETLDLWETPKFTWVNGVPGCGKTTWIVRNFDPNSDVVVTTTIEAAKDLREKLEPRLGVDAKDQVRTMASVLVNGLKEPNRTRCNRLIVDEALMNHFGAIVMATRLAGASETLLIGDRNQLPYIDRNNLFELNYCRPNQVAKVDQELLCTHKNPMDVAFALSTVYDGIYSSKSQIRSLEIKRYSGSQIPNDLGNTLYLTHSQSEKEALKAMGYGTGLGSRVNTNHEAQGATFETVMLIRMNPKKIQLHDSVPHAVVAVSRHTKNCTYYTDDTSDATAHFISKSAKATLNQIREYNVKMAIRAGDEQVTRAILTMTNQEINKTDTQTQSP